MADQTRQIGGGRTLFGDFAPKLASLTDDVLFADFLESCRAARSRPQPHYCGSPHRRRKHLAVGYLTRS
jgi:hypothetical protein